MVKVKEGKTKDERMVLGGCGLQLCGGACKAAIWNWKEVLHLKFAGVRGGCGSAIRTKERKGKQESVA